MLRICSSSSLGKVEVSRSSLMSWRVASNLVLTICAHTCELSRPVLAPLRAPRDSKASFNARASFCFVPWKSIYSNRCARPFYASAYRNQGHRVITAPKKLCSRLFFVSWRLYAAQSDAAGRITCCLRRFYRDWHGSTRARAVRGVARRFFSYYRRYGIVLPHLKLPVPVSEWLAG